MSQIKIYRVDKWVNKWVVGELANEFYWYTSAEAPKDQFVYNPMYLRALTESGLSHTAKAVFFFMLLHRFSSTRVCLYGNTAISKHFGCSAKTATKAINELVDNNILKKMKLYVNRNLAYQYYIADYTEWDLPEGKLTKEKNEGILETLDFGVSPV